jgi:NO-binding membrane sensor protein with MHYT domain
MQPGDLVPFDFSGPLMGLSFLVSALGAYVALLAAGRVRDESRDGQVHLGYVGLAALALGGVGIWSMHFIGMQAQVFPFDMGYQPGLTILSLVVAVVFSGLAIWFVAASSVNPWRYLVGGVFAGAAVAAMHYIGVAAMRMPGFFEWRPGMVLLSILIAIAAATTALWLAFNLVTERQRIFAAGVMALAVCGMHYTGALVICTAPRDIQGLLLGGHALPYAVFAISLATLAAMRWQLHRTSTEYRQRLSERMDALLGQPRARRRDGAR